jgi:hypothetical protein
MMDLPNVSSKSEFKKQGHQQGIMDIVISIVSRLFAR